MSATRPPNAGTMLNQFSVNWRNEKKMIIRASHRFFIVDLYAAVSVTPEL
jgi:hypothetical protein